MTKTLPDTPAHYAPELERVEIGALFSAVFQHYGYDFRAYAYSSAKRRLWKLMEAEGIATVSALQERVLHEPAMLDKLLMGMSVCVTEMFRDPDFYAAFREHAVPLLRTYPFIRIWHAGCATGEEVYSMAILLEEEDLLERCRIYATDMNEEVLRRAREGIYPVDRMKDYTRNYLRSGGTRAFSEYYTSLYDGARFDPRLTRNVVFAQHNLAVDQSFAECNVILCRNVMIYFDPSLQKRVHELFLSSLARFGLLALGLRESLRFTAVEAAYEALSEPHRIYRRRL